MGVDNLKLAESDRYDLKVIIAFNGIFCQVFWFSSIADSAKSNKLRVHRFFCRWKDSGFTDFFLGGKTPGSQIFF